MRATPGWWYDMDGNELPDMAAVNALMSDPDARRVALTDFDGRAQVSTVLLVVNHNWAGDGPPLIFETMTFLEGNYDVAYERASTKEQALAMHDQACATVREMLARFDAEVASMVESAEPGTGGAP